MILDAIATLLTAVLTGMFGLMPSWSLPGSMTSFGSTFGSTMAGLNGVFPMVTLGVCIGILVGARVFIFLMGLAVFVYRLIPLKFT